MDVQEGPRFCGPNLVDIEFQGTAAAQATPDEAQSFILMVWTVFAEEIVGDGRDADDSAGISDHLPFGCAVGRPHPTAARDIRVEDPYAACVLHDRHRATGQGARQRDV